MSCLTACSPEVTPMVLATCSVTTKPGGIRAIGVMLCDAEFSDVSGGAITDAATWQTLIDDAKIFVSGQVIGSKAQGSDTNTRVASCLPEVKTGSSKVISVRDYNSDPENFTEYAFYSSIESNAGYLKFFYITCDELVYFYENGIWSASIDDVRPETKEEATHMAITVTVNELGIKTPVKVVGILDII